MADYMRLESQGRACARPSILLLLTIHDHEQHTGSFKSLRAQELSLAPIISLKHLLQLGRKANELVATMLVYVRF